VNAGGAFMASPKTLASPEKEVRFTRSAQGRLFLVLTAGLLALSLGLVALATQGTEFEAPRLEGYLWTALLPLIAAWFLARLGIRCIRHAYIIFTPLGVEIFPLFRPEATMQLLLWSTIDSLECDVTSQRMIIHFTAEKTAGVIVSLAPILPAQRELLQRLIVSVSQQRAASSNSSPTL
jgi:hypothetical protein